MLKKRCDACYGRLEGRKGHGWVVGNRLIACSRDCIPKVVWRSQGSTSSQPRVISKSKQRS